MRIGIDYTAAINQSAGIGRFVRNLFQAVAEIDQDNDYVLVHAVPNVGRLVEPPMGPNVSTRQLRFRERLMTILWHRLHVPLPVDVFTGPLDLFHAPDFVLPPVRNGIRIITVHDLGFLIHPECADDGLREFLEQAVPRSVSEADYIIADSENTRNDVICLLDADPDHVFVVHGGVDPSFHPEDDEAVAEMRDTYELTQPYVLALGVIEPRKNLPRLIEAYTRFRVRTGLRYQLVIAGGRGWLCEDTFNHAQRSAFASDICFTGFVPDKHLPALYTGAEVFAYPSLYEGFGLPVLEAMACGTPVVCADSSSLPEFAGDAALLVPPEDSDAIADALEIACTDKATRDRLTERGAERAGTYQWKRSAEQLIEIYERAYKAAS